jgi:hypothetical protein
MNRIACTVVVCLAFAAPAAAQQDEPIGRYIFDARGVYGRHKVEPRTPLDVNGGGVEIP